MCQVYYLLVEITRNFQIFVKKEENRKVFYSVINTHCVNTCENTRENVKTKYQFNLSSVSVQKVKN